MLHKNECRLCDLSPSEHIYAKSIFGVYPGCKIENNFSPFLTVRLGGVLSLDGEETGTFRERWKAPDTQISPGGFLGIGIDFNLVGQSSVSVMVGLELLPLNKKIDGMDDYSGTLIHISFNRRFK